MKRPAGLIVFASMLFLMSMNLLQGRSASVVLTDVWVLRSVLGVISLGTAYALWNRRSDAMKAYWTWAVAWLVGGGMSQYFHQDAPLLHVVLWWIFVGAVLWFVGVYLKGIVRQTA